MWLVFSLETGPEPVAHRVLGEVLEPAADRVPAGVAGERVGPQQRPTLTTRITLPRPDAEAAALGLWKARIASQVLISEMSTAA